MKYFGSCGHLNTKEQKDWVEELEQSLKKIKLHLLGEEKLRYDYAMTANAE